MHDITLRLSRHRAKVLGGMECHATTDASTSRAKRKRKVLTIKDKINIIKQLRSLLIGEENGESVNFLKLVDM